MVDITEKKFNSREAEEILGFKPGALVVMRCRGRGPAFYKNGRRVVYGESQLRAWLEMNARQTSESVTHQST